ncbi:hypothetical protein [Phenylobacterium sp.]|uniref:hypothetical protein n=1 Tax=Phenylobacterium sp. TaxID=1871053 RepID=UPI0035B3D69B
MLSACASDSKPTRLSHPDAALTVRTKRELVCPAEVLLDLPPRADPAPGADLRANAEADDYLDDKDGREDLLEARLRDAKTACAKAAEAR